MFGLIGADEEHSKQRLRFISIYSSEKKDDILTTIFSELSQLNGVSISEVDDGLDITLESGHKACRISHISKHVPEEDLADHLISGFAEFAGGFLPNILLSAISEIRNHTYEYLALFNKDLDTALLSHFMALHTQKGTFPTAEMQFREYSTNLVSDHLKARLHFSPKLGAIASKETITKYLNDCDQIQLFGGDFEHNQTDDLLGIVNAAKFGDITSSLINFFGLDKEDRKEDKKAFKKKPPAFHLKNGGEKTHDELSALDLLSRSFLQKIEHPPLKLGSILKSSTSEDFFVCIQPLCDGLRLTDQRAHAFPFLQLTSERDKFGLVVPYENELLRFSCETKPRNIVTFMFKPMTGDKDIRCKTEEDGKYPLLETNDKKHNFQWLCELKDIYSQEILHALASQGSRVGSDKFEWLRLKS